MGVTSGDDRVCIAGVPGSWTLGFASMAVLVVNIAVWLAGYRYLQAEQLSCRPLFLTCVLAYVGIAVAAFFVDHEHNFINRYYLDVRWPETYVVKNPDELRDLDRHAGAIKNKIGPDLAALLKDPAFIGTLHHGKFYKQHSDEGFQLNSRAVIYSYRPESTSGAAHPAFVAVRFPKELADALRFESVGP